MLLIEVNISMWVLNLVTELEKNDNFFSNNNTICSVLINTNTTHQHVFRKINNWNRIEMGLVEIKYMQLLKIEDPFGIMDNQPVLLCTHVLFVIINK